MRNSFVSSLKAIFVSYWQWNMFQDHLRVVKYNHINLWEKISIWKLNITYVIKSKKLKVKGILSFLRSDDAFHRSKNSLKWCFRKWQIPWSFYLKMKLSLEKLEFSKWKTRVFASKNISETDLNFFFFFKFLFWLVFNRNQLKWPINKLRCLFF